MSSSVLDVGEPRLLSSGAAAIVAALAEARVGAGGSVLLPAFNCPAMVAAIASRGATPRFYRIGADLAIGEAQIAAAWTQDTRAVLVPHLFGRQQELQPIRELCERRAAILVEDCAHMFLGGRVPVELGRVGHYAVASPRKFLPLVEGGLLTSDRFPLGHGESRQRPDWLRGCRLLFDGVDIAAQYGRLRGTRPAIAALKAVARTASRGGRRLPAPQDAPLDAQTIDSMAATLPTRVLLRRTLTEEAMNRRRSNYDYLVRALARVPGARVLEHSAGRVAQAVPYMVPLLLSDAGRQFPALKDRGVPMWRWEYSARGHCEVADWLAESLIQLPCHQSLSRADLDWIAAHVDDVFGGAGTRVASAGAMRPTSSDDGQG